MTNTDQNQTTNELVITREFNAPKELLWKAWTDPEHCKRWWGPKNYTSPVCNIDLRVGGKYLSSMRSDDGLDIWSTGVYREIIPFKKLVLTDSFSDDKGTPIHASNYNMPGNWPPELLITVEFEEQDGRTEMTLTHERLPEEMKDMCRDGWNESFDKLDEQLTNI